MPRTILLFFSPTQMSLHNTVFLVRLIKKVQLAIGEHGSLGNSDSSHVTSVGEVAIRRAHVTDSTGVLIRKHSGLQEAGALWGEVRLCIYVTTLVKVKI